MIEITLTIILVCSLAAASYYFALCRSKDVIIALQKERIEVEISEKKQWQEKCLRKEGHTPLNWTRPERPEKEFHEIMPRAVTTSQLAARRTPSNPEVQIIPPDRVNYDKLRRKEAVGIAGEIINATRE